MSNLGEKEINFDFNITNLNFTTIGVECDKCPNHCEIITIRKDNKLIDAWGNRCERGAIKN